jgi:hypothetical protein
MLIDKRHRGRIALLDVPEDHPVESASRPHACGESPPDEKLTGPGPSTSSSSSLSAKTIAPLK